MSTKEIIAGLDRALKPLGFSRTKETWNRNVGTFVDVLDVQISKTGDRATLNLGVLEREVYADCWGKEPDQLVETPFCTVNSRIGELTDQRDEWWPVHDEASVQDMISKTLDLSVPFFERLHSLEGLSEWLVRTTSKKGPYPLPSISLAVVQHRLGNRSEACTRLHDLLKKTTGAWKERAREVAERLGCS